jgi:hypothetical protein
MVRRALIVLCIGLMTVIMASCGQTYELQSITIAPDTGYDLVGLAKSGQLTVTAHFSNTKTEDVTAKSLYQVGASQDPRAPLGAVTVNNSGLVQNSANVGVCTWYATPTGTGAANTTFGYYTYPYTVTVTYSGHTAQTQISVNSVADCYDGTTGNTPPAGYPGTGTDGY